MDNKTLILLVGIIIIAFVVLSLAKKEKNPEMPYTLKKVFLKAYEMDVINAIASLGLYPAPKVRIADFVRTTSGKVKYRSPISSRSVDFLVLNPDEKFKPVACIVFSINKNKEFVQKLANKINIPCVIVVPHSTAEEIKNKIQTEVINDEHDR